MAPGECRRILSLPDASLTRSANLAGQPHYYTICCIFEQVGRKDNFIFLSKDKIIFLSHRGMPSKGKNLIERFALKPERERPGTDIYRHLAAAPQGNDRYLRSGLFKGKSKPVASTGDCCKETIVSRIAE